ncbi:hypothetical protein CDG60_15400 [Acinetobacter chinensis]|uniref:Lipoprotein n=1 Tax=Acinetobacter chinensis TaxID=2004650 RepID=A0A3B7LY28_9GAMM|nr:MULTISPECIES: hypothetical protein [Acinetobacter]AXY57830.1 hypothetical protein CDG60_15400 [Acinetobacter chinensis]AXY59115.1 hypothetical protein CDG61_03110 [Acinetobacter sp. WCHAc010052]
MKFIKGTLALALTGLLAACGGGGSDGYYNNAGSSGGNNNGGPTTPTDPENPTNPDSAQAILNSLKKEGQFLFGNYDPTDATTAKGYIDHAIDTFAQGPLELTLAIRNVNLDGYKLTHYRKKCFAESTNDYRACYVFIGEEIKTLIPGYGDWDFDITADDLKNIKLQHDNITPNLDEYQSNTRIYIFENENGDKNFQDVTITGAFAYPFQQSWGLTQTRQKRFVLINGSTSDYKITTTILVNDPVTGLPVEKEITTGAVSIYKDLTSTDGSLYNIQAGSGFNVLINDNANVPFAEPISFNLASTPGSSDSAYYRLKADGTEVLSLPNITAIDGTRVENEDPSTNTQSFTGSIYMEGNNIFQFRQSANGSILKFKHKFNDITFEGQSVNNNGTIKTTLTQPSGVTY